MIWRQENRVEWWFYFPKKGNSSKRGSKEMPLRYLSVTLIVTERKAYCILILSYLACFWMSQPDYLFGQQWECYCHLAFVQLWHDVSVYRTCKKYSPCSQGMEMLKRFVSFHYPLSDVSIFWGGWHPTVLENSGWTKGPWAERLALGYTRSQAVHRCKWYLASQIRLWSCCHWPSLFFFLFFNKIFVALSQSRVAVVIMMPWNLGTRFSVARSIPIEYQAGLESPRGLTFWFFGDSWEEREESTVGVH